MACSLTRPPALSQTVHLGLSLHGLASDECLNLQLGGGKVTDPKDIDKLRASLERLANTSGRILARVSSGKRPLVGDGIADTAAHNKTLLYNLKGACVPPLTVQTLW